MKLECYELLSSFDFSSKLRRYIMDGDEAAAVHSAMTAAVEGAGAPAAWPVLMPVHGPARGSYEGRAGGGGGGGGGKALHSSTFRLKVSALCGIRWVHDYPPVY